MKGLRDLTSRRISDAAMFTPNQPARIVLQDSTVVADAQQTDIMPIRISEAIKMCIRDRIQA